MGKKDFMKYTAKNAGYAGDGRTSSPYPESDIKKAIKRAQDKYKPAKVDSQWISKATSDIYKAGDSFDETGIFESARFGPTDDGFVIATFITEDGEAIVCKGNVAGFVIGAPYHITGKVIEDKKWGIQVNVSHAVAAKPKTKDQIVSFLGSGAIPGIGPITAKRIYNHFGEDTLHVLEEEPERLIEVSGIGKKNIEKMIDILPKQLKYREVIGFFTELGITMRTITRLIDEYGAGAKDAIQKNPYILCRVRGFAFTRADSIAMKMGIPKNDPNRLYAGVLQTLRWNCEMGGHTLLPLDLLVEQSKAKLEINDEGIIKDAIKRLLNDNRIVKTELGYQLKYLNKAEETIKESLQRALIPDSLLTEDRVDELIGECSRRSGMKLTDEQKAAVHNLFSRKISIMSANAGCGKTYTCRMIVDVAKSAGYNVCLMSPTGRAAKHLSDICGAPGYTMHRALSIMVKGNADDDFFADNEMNIGKMKEMSAACRCFQEAEIVIADEASMMDTEMAAILFAACRGKHLMLVGDPNQLPSVGPGRVLGDIMESTYSQVHGMLTMLTKVFRQAEGSPVIEAATRVQEGKSPVGTPGIRFYDVKSNEEVPEMIEKHVLPYIAKRKLGYENYAFLSPIKKTPYSGVNALNDFLRPKLNSHYQKPEKPELEFLFQQGDFVMQTKNNYDIDIYNGDIGIVESIGRDGEVEVVFSACGEDECVEYEKEEVYSEHQLIPAFAMTVHKSQGDQYDLVVLVMTSSHNIMLSRNLLYTAVTRAENELVLIGDAKAFAMAARNQKENSRMTGLRGI